MILPIGSTLCEHDIIIRGRHKGKYIDSKRVGEKVLLSNKYLRESEYRFLRTNELIRKGDLLITHTYDKNGKIHTLYLPTCRVGERGSKNYVRRID